MPQFDPTFWLILITWFSTITIFALIALHQILNMYLFLQYLRLQLI
jgi:uncharacterized protein (DUF983 family)